MPFRQLPIYRHVDKPEIESSASHWRIFTSERTRVVGSSGRKLIRVWTAVPRWEIMAGRSKHGSGACQRQLEGSLGVEFRYAGDTNYSPSMNISLLTQVMAKLRENGGKVPQA